MFDARDNRTENLLRWSGWQEKGREKFYVHLMYRLRRPDRWITIIPVAGVVKYRDHACLKPILGRYMYALSSAHVASAYVHGTLLPCKDASSATGICFPPLEFWNTEYIFLLSWKLPNSLSYRFNPLVLWNTYIHLHEKWTFMCIQRA